MVFLFCYCCPHLTTFLVLFGLSPDRSSRSSNKRILEGRRGIELNLCIWIVVGFLFFCGVSDGDDLFIKISIIGIWVSGGEGGMLVGVLVINWLMSVQSRRYFLWFCPAVLAPWKITCSLKSGLCLHCPFLFLFQPIFILSLVL